jgi:hypothetical protein
LPPERSDTGRSPDIPPMSTPMVLVLRVSRFMRGTVPHGPWGAGWCRASGGKRRLVRYPAATLALSGTVTWPAARRNAAVL